MYDVSKTSSRLRTQVLGSDAPDKLLLSDKNPFRCQQYGDAFHACYGCQQKFTTRGRARAKAGVAPPFGDPTPLHRGGSLCLYSASLDQRRTFEYFDGGLWHNTEATIVVVWRAGNVPARIVLRDGRVHAARTAVRWREGAGPTTTLRVGSA